jgi:hypothetical protein
MTEMIKIIIEVQIIKEENNEVLLKTIETIKTSIF